MNDKVFYKVNLGVKDNYLRIEETLEPAMDDDDLAMMIELARDFGWTVDAGSYVVL